MVEIFLMIKFLEKLRITVNLTNGGIPTDPRRKSLLNMVFMVKYYLY